MSWMLALNLVALGLLVIGWVRFKRRTKKPMDALAKWHKSYADWVRELEGVTAKFPDHSALEGCQYGEGEARVLNKISDLYSEDLYDLTTRFALMEGELKRRLTSKE